MATNNAVNLKDQGTVYYNGTNTFTGIDASTAGFVLTSNGTGVAPSFQAAAGVSELLAAKVTLTSAQIKALRATPIQIVAAPGAGKVIMPVSVYYYFLYAGTNVFTNAQTIAARTNNAGTYVNEYEFGFNTTALAAAASALQSAVAISSGAVLTSVTTDMINKPLVVHNTGASEITGNAGNDNTLSVAVMYYVWTL